MTRLFGIYIRVSSEMQGDKASPQIQEADNTELAKSLGGHIVAIYRDTERYRVGRKLVEPSGTRNDRPAFKQMLVDLRSGLINTVIAWREDRLYRASRPMLDFIETIQETKADVYLAKENFDKTIAPVKAWAAGLELAGKHDRFIMGGAGRFMSGRDWNQQPPYGYQRVDGKYFLLETEAKWVRFIWEKYADGLTMPKISKLLQEAGAPQRRSKHNWSVARVQQVLDHAFYWSGKVFRKWGGAVYELDIPALVPALVAERVNQRRAQYVAYPAGHTIHDTLVAGLIWCAACQSRMGLRSTTSDYRWHYTYYFCYSYSARTHQPGCAASVRTKKIDDLVWAECMRFISQPDRITEATERHIAQLEKKLATSGETIAKLEVELEGLLLERQRVITWARQKIISEDDLAQQLATIDWQAAALKGKIAEAGGVSQSEIDTLRQAAEEVRHFVELGYRVIRAAGEENDAIREFKRKAVKLLVSKIEVTAEKGVHISWTYDSITELTASWRLCDQHSLVVTS